MRKILAVLIALIIALALAIVVRSQVEQNTDARGSARSAVPAAEQPRTPAPAATTPAPPPVLTPAGRDSAAAAAPPAGAPATPAQPEGVPQSADAASALQRAAAAYAGVRSLRADFTQWQDNPLLRRRTNSQGTLFQRQPDRFLMKFTQPAGDLIVSDGEYFWIYYPSADAKQVLRTRAAAVGGLDLQSQFIGDPTQRFQFTDHGREEVSGRMARVITLVPREPAGYRSLKVWIDERDHLVRRFELTNENNVLQHFELSNLQVNPVLGDELFRFTPPADARVVER